jgi:hypothetical protein
LLCQGKNLQEQGSVNDTACARLGISHSLVPDEANKKQQHYGPDKCTNKRAQKSVGRDAKQAENKPAQNRADHSHHDVAEHSKAISFNNHASQKSGCQSNEYKPYEVHSYFVLIVVLTTILPCPQTPFSWSCTFGYLFKKATNNYESNGVVFK